MAVERRDLGHHLPDIHHDHHLHHNRTHSPVTHTKPLTPLRQPSPPPRNPPQTPAPTTKASSPRTTASLSPVSPPATSPPYSTTTSTTTTANLTNQAPTAVAKRPKNREPSPGTRSRMWGVASTLESGARARMVRGGGRGRRRRRTTIPVQTSGIMRTGLLDVDNVESLILLMCGRSLGSCASSKGSVGVCRPSPCSDVLWSCTSMPFSEKYDEQQGERKAENSHQYQRHQRGNAI